MSRRQKRDAAREAARQQRAASKERLTTMSASEIPSAGGFESRTTSDTRLLAKAIRKGWNIPQTVFDAAPMAMAGIMADRSMSPRNRIAATRALAIMHGQNLDADKDTEPPTVNVQVNNVVQVAAIADRDEAELERFVNATSGAGGIGTEETNGYTLPGGVLSALANGKTVPVSANGKH